MTGSGFLIKKPKGTAVFHQEALSVRGIQLLVNISARQEYCFPGSKGTEPKTPDGGETDHGVPWTRSRRPEAYH